MQRLALLDKVLLSYLLPPQYTLASFFVRRLRKHTIRNLYGSRALWCGNEHLQEECCSAASYFMVSHLGHKNDNFASNMHYLWSSTLHKKLLASTHMNGLLPLP